MTQPLCHCSVKECNKHLLAKGLCGMHYMRVRKHGKTAPTQVRGDDKKRFLSYVKKSKKCWQWRGNQNHDGYGQIIMGGKTFQAHRYAWSSVNGRIPDKLQIDHLCRNRLCVRPSHLEAVTQRENVRRGWRSRGKQSGLPLGVTNYKNGKYIARVSIGVKNVYIGIYNTPEEAHAAFITYPI